MNTIFENNFGVNERTPTKKIIPDNDYLPFVPVKKTLLDMEVGDIIVWPIQKLNSVRVLATRINRKFGRTYRCIKNRKENTFDVCRFS